jgi:hypothetical protein
MGLLENGLADLRDQFLSKRNHSVQSSDSIKKSTPTVLSGIPVFPRYDKGLLAIYDRALIFDDSFTNDRPPPQVVSAVIIYNMGLMHHIQGVHLGLSKFFSRAYQFYQISLDVLEKDGLHDKVDPLISLALFNNMAHAADYLFRADDMRNAFESMRSILTTDGDCLDDQDYDIFYINSICSPTIPNLAPAA